MASVVIICSAIGLYRLHKHHKAKKALRLEEEKEMALANEQSRVLQQLEDDASSVYSGNTLTNELRDGRVLARTEATESSILRSGTLRRKVKAMTSRRRSMRDGGDASRAVGHFR